MSETLWFPDNSTLCNFGAVDAIGVLERVLRDRGRWTTAVAHEVKNSVGHIPALGVPVEELWLGDPVTIDVADAARVESIRVAVFGGSARLPLEHLGEAETVFVMSEFEEYSQSVWITDDRAAYAYGKQRTVVTRSTRDIVEHLIADGDLTNSAGFDLLCDMVDAGRYVHRMPASMRDLS